MSTKHLSKGDPCPPLESGKLRLYSMKFCPFADRTRLVLHAKNIPFELVNINTCEKPEWFSDKNPNALVPVLEKDGHTIWESLITAEYLDELYPDQRPLYPKDPYEKARDKMVIGMFNDKINREFLSTAAANGTNHEAKEKFLSGLAKLEHELKERATEFFAGKLPGMVDFMMWPFFRRIQTHKTMSPSGDDLPDSLPTLKAWKSRMFLDPSVKSILMRDEAYVEFRTVYRTPKVDFEIE